MRKAIAATPNQEIAVDFIHHFALGKSACPVSGRLDASSALCGSRSSVILEWRDKELNLATSVKTIIVPIAAKSMIKLAISTKG